MKLFDRNKPHQNICAEKSAKRIFYSSYTDEHCRSEVQPLCVRAFMLQGSAMYFSFEIPSASPFDGSRIDTYDKLKSAADALKSIPSQFNETVGNLSDSQLDKKTEKGIWSVRQVVHHAADSHMNAYIRFKSALTLESPVIMPYPEDLWAEFPDSKSSDIQHSLDILKGIHFRWADTLSSLNLNDLQKSYYHPGDRKYISLDMQVPMYIWHGRYHLGFIMRTLI